LLACKQRCLRWSRAGARHQWWGGVLIAFSTPPICLKGLAPGRDGRADQQARAGGQQAAQRVQAGRDRPVERRRAMNVHVFEPEEVGAARFDRVVNEVV
jgi:hypothetical protein